MTCDDHRTQSRLIDEAVRRVLIAHDDMTIDVDTLRHTLREHHRRGSRDMFSLVKAGREFVHERRSGAVTS